jgi:hypothetical protein
MVRNIDRRRTLVSILVYFGVLGNLGWRLGV